MLSEENYGKAFSLHLGHKRVVFSVNMDDIQRLYKAKCKRRPETTVSEWRLGQ